MPANNAMTAAELAALKCSSGSLLASRLLRSMMAIGRSPSADVSVTDHRRSVSALNVGLNAAPDIDARAKLALAELIRITSDVMVGLGYSSKLNAEWAFLEMLFEEGRRAAIAFGQKHLPDLGVRSTFEIDDLLTQA
jgi:hypothetical protein